VSVDPTACSRGKGLFGDGDLNLVQHRLVGPGQPLAGHVGLIMDASQCTYVLQLCALHWVRDTGLLDVGRPVHKLSRRRRVAGLADRGMVAPGYFADVNVVDRQGLELQAPDMLSDLPFGRVASCNEPAATATHPSRAGPDRP